jgi:phasin family protein
VTGKAIGFAGQKIATSFALAQNLVRAKDVKEMLELQGTSVKTQMQALAEQARELGETSSKVATDQLKLPPKA